MRSLRYSLFKKRWLLVALAAMLMFTGSARDAEAQSLTGEIDGTVRDASGSLVAGANVTVTNTDRQQVVRTVITNNVGSFTAPLLETGNYQVSVESPGFKKTVVLTDVHQGQSATLAVALETGGVLETVNVTTDAVVPQLENAAASSVVSGTQVRELSLSSRNFEQLLYLQPGISGRFRDLSIEATSPPPELPVNRGFP